MKTRWETKKIGEICDLMTGGTPSRSNPEYFSNGSIKWLVSGDIHLGEIFDCEGRITEAGFKSSNAKYLPVNSVLIALNGQGKTRGTVALLRTLATCNQSLVSINPKNPLQLLPEFLFYNLHGRYEEIRKLTSDANNDRRGLNMPIIRNIEVSFPPLPEQQRIVRILDEAFAGIAVARANAEKNLQNAREVFDSYLNAIFSELAESFENKPLGEYCSFENGDRGKNYPSKSARTVSGIPFINAGHLSDIGIDFRSMDYISRERYLILGAGKIRPGDILFCLRGSLGKFASVGTLKEGAIASSLVIVRPEKALSADYLLFYFNSQLCTKMINQFKNGTAQPNLSANSLSMFVIPVPPIQVQEKVIEDLQRIMLEKNHLESVYRHKLRLLDELMQSLLHQAFSGEL